MLLSLVVFLLVLSFLVFIHELGHFLVAKWTGMRVDEFAIGFPPRIWGFKRGETQYSLNSIPFGGYVKIHGEQPGTEDDEEDPRSFDHKPVRARVAVILAGVTMNTLFAYVALLIAFAIGFTSIRQDLAAVPGATITKREVVIVGTPEEALGTKAGLKEGDVVREISGATGSIAVGSMDELLKFLRAEQEAGSTGVTITRQNLRGDREAVPSSINPDGPALGVMIQSADTVRVPLTQAPVVAAKEVGVIVDLTWDALKGFWGKLVTKAELDENVSGPVGIYQATAIATKLGFAQVIFLMVMLSLNLALLNVLPFPALDGGRFVFLIIEGVFRRRVVQRQVEAALTTASFVFLIGLMVLLTARDLLRLF